MKNLLPRSCSVGENGINLYYLYWGGLGLMHLLLSGMGCSTYIFQEFAPRFIDRFQVLAPDRRGHRDSDCPDTGYDPDTLAKQALLADLPCDNQRGQAYGFYVMSVDLGATIGPFGAAWFYQV